MSIYYDPMIAKVIATAETRALAIARLSAALREFEIAGIRTNRAFLLAILESDAFRDGKIDTAFLDREGSAIAQSSVDRQQSSVESAVESAIRNPQSAIRPVGERRRRPRRRRRRPRGAAHRRPPAAI